MVINFILLNFELIAVSILFVIALCTLIILFIQGKFIDRTNKKLDSYQKQIQKNNSELAEYLKTLSNIIDNNKQKLEILALKISDLEKKLSSIKTIKGDDDLLTLAIDMARSGSTKEDIKSKTGLNDQEIETIYAYHKNVRN